MRPLPDEFRYALLGAPYEAPSVEPGDLLYCAYEGRRVVVAGFSRALIPWPYHVKDRGRQRVIVSEALARAVKVEANLAVAHHWGVPSNQVSSWRKALGVGRVTGGTSMLFHRYGLRPPPGETVPGIVLVTRRPEVRRQLAATQRGRRMPPHVAAILHEADAWKVADKRRLEQLFREGASDREIAEALDRSSAAVSRQRLSQGLLRAAPRPQRSWTESEKQRLEELSRQGATIREIAEALGRSQASVNERRRRSGLRRQLAVPWTESEKRCLEELFRQGAGDREIAEALGRSSSGVRVRRRRQGLRTPDKSTSWEESEKRRLQELVGQGATDREIAEELGRSTSTIRDQRYRQGLKKVRSRWDKSHEKRLQELFRQGASNHEIAETLGFSVPTVSSQLRRLGLRRRRPWDENEDRRLKKLVREGANNRQIAEALGRTTKGVSIRRSRLRLKDPRARVPDRWHKSEILRLKEMVRLGASNREIAEVLRRELHSVKNKRRYLRLPRPSGHGAPWRSGEDQRLERLFRKGASDQEIAEALGRSALAVKLRRKRLGLWRTRSNTPWTEEELARLEALSRQGASNREIAEALGRSADGVNYQRQRRGLRRPPSGGQRRDQKP